ANYKVPKQVEFREDLPKSIVGKVLRRVIREEEERKGHCECNGENGESDLVADQAN
ncbi:hypothetical protein RSW31_24925, partial [Escherichia coli]|uniref:hypothetical protein n=1 Tax=Escherichia coli TaxID=562 RepID=UPI0028DE0E8C